MMVTPNENAHTVMTVTISVCLSSCHQHHVIHTRVNACISTNPLCGAGPEIHPNSAKMLARISIPRMAPTSCHDGQVPGPRVTKINQFCDARKYQLSAHSMRFAG